MEDTYTIEGHGPWTAAQRKKFRYDTMMAMRYFKRHMPLSDGRDRVMDIFRDTILEHGWIGDDVR